MDEKIILDQCSKERLIEMLIEERITHREYMKQQIEKDKKVINTLNSLISSLKHPLN